MGSKNQATAKKSHTTAHSQYQKLGAPMVNANTNKIPDAAKKKPDARRKVRDVYLGLMAVSFVIGLLHVAPVLAEG